MTKKISRYTKTTRESLAHIQINNQQKIVLPYIILLIRMHAQQYPKQSKCIFLIMNKLWLFLLLKQLKQRFTKSIKMRERIAQILADADQFGALTQISFLNNDVKFKTIYGGILSLIIYVLGFSYFLYLMVMWQTYKTLPSVTNQLQSNQGLRVFKLHGNIFEFSLEVNNRTTREEQLSKIGSLYTIKIISTDINSSLTHNINNFNCTVKDPLIVSIEPICMNMNDEYQTILYSNSQNRSQNTNIDFLINQCDPTSGNCLNLEQQQYILSLPEVFWRLTLITQDINIITGAIITIEQDYYFNVIKYSAPGSTLNFDLKVRKTTYIIDDGILFTNEKQYEVAKSIQITVSQNNMFDEITNYPTIADITYSLDGQEEIIRVTYPKLGQILADLGSILQVLLLFGIVMNRFNTDQMKLKIENILILIYFPQIKLFEFNYDWRGKIRTIFFKGQLLLDEEFKQIKEFRETTGKQLTSKLNYINTLHEISRLQIQLQLKISRKQIIELQQQGYQMDLPHQKSEIIAEEDYKFDSPFDESLGLITMFGQQQRVLNQEDFQLIIHQNLKTNDQQDFKFSISPKSDFDNPPILKLINELPIIQKVR